MRNYIKKREHIMSENFKNILESHKQKFADFNETEIAKAPKLITQIHILDGCNLRCKHCYVGDRRFKPGPPLSLEEVVKRVQILKEFQEKHGFKGHTMNISGGEPTIHPDLLEIMREIRKRDITPFLLTNGMNMTRKFAQQIKDAGCNLVQISLEGTESSNDEIRGKGVFQKALESIKLLKELDFRVVIGITISKMNIDQLEELWKLLDGKVNKFHMREVTPIGAAEGFNKIGIEERWNLYKKINSWSGKTRVFLEDPPFCTIDPEQVEKRAGCAAMICLMCIDTDGSVYPCRKAPYKMGSIEDIETAWNNPIAKKMRVREFEGPCGTCNIKGSCGGCRGYAYALGNILGSDDRCFLQIDDL